MGSFLRVHELRPDDLASASAYIACTDCVRLRESLLRDWAWFNVGLELSAALLREKVPNAIWAASELLKRLVSDCPGRRIILDRIDILFMPDFQFDVLRLISQLNRNKNFVVIWPGTRKEHLLIYSEPRYPDFHVYDLRNYDLDCIID